MTERGDVITMPAHDGEEQGRLLAIPERLMPFLETLADTGAFGRRGDVEAVISTMISNQLERYVGTPLMPADVLEEKRRARRRGGPALW